VVLWNKFGEFKPGSNFFAWASRIAYFEMINLLKQQRRAPVLSEASLQALVNEARALSDRTSERAAALDDCLAELVSGDRDLIQERYFFQRSPKEMAANRSRSLDSIYRALGRIHKRLLSCVERKLAQEEGQ
jgi:RNA polymerase sigma-70 factor, ECF subfamily